VRQDFEGRMTKVAILGSCITRDLWPVRGDGIEGLAYVSRTSLPSLFSPPVAGIRPSDPAADGLTIHQRRAMAADLAKTALGRLVAFRPTHLIIDLIDERFDLLRVGSALATHSWELETSGQLGAPAFREAQPIRRLSAACDRLWETAAGQLAALVRSTALGDARLILHTARWAELSRGPRGLTPITDVRVLGGQPADIGQHNALLARYEAALAAAMPPMERVEADDLRIADEAHQWGLSPFHYVPDYYDDIARQLGALGVPLDAT
jgi:hypothetical protein